MADKLKNILKHKTQFTKIKSDREIHNLYIERKSSIYQSGKIQNGNLVNINSVEDLYRMVRPFTEYSISKEKQKRGVDYLIIEYDIQVITYNKKYAEGHQNFTLLNTKHEHKQNDDVCCSSTIIEYEESDNNVNYFKNPFQIQIVKHRKYKQKKHYEKRVGLEKPRNTNECVVCLTNYPNILFFPCLHWCVCEECEETQPFRTFPYCRSEIYRKVHFGF